MKSYAYYPGCALKGMTAAYDTSARRVADVFELELEELEDWNCCGATSYTSVHELLSYSISARNLVLAEKTGKELITPCSACYAILNKTDHYYKLNADLKAKVDQCLQAANLSYHGGAHVRHLLDIFVNDVPVDTLRSKATKTLRGLKLAPYYGCQIVRPKNTFDHCESPTTLDTLLENLGAEVVEYAYKVKCCGASLAIYDENAAFEFIDKLLYCAVKNEADAIVTTCPLCHMNLDNYQPRINRIFDRSYKMPILYFTQAIGLAIGFTMKEMAIDKAITPVGKTFKSLFA